MRRALTGVGWVVAAGLAVVVVVRLVPGDESRVVIVLVRVLTPLLLLPAYVLLAAALVGRRWVLSGVAAVAVGFHLVWTFPMVHAPEPRLAGAHLTLLALNVEYDHPTGPRVIAEIEHDDPDVVVLSELNPFVSGQIKASPLSVRYPYSVVTPGLDAFGEGIYSKVPVTGADWDVDGLPMLRGWLTVGGERVRIYQVHTTAPRGTARPQWAAQLATLRTALAGEQPSCAPVIVAGDFNASRDLTGFARILSAGYRDAEDGHGLFATWPADRLEPVLRLDHVLMSSRVTSTGVRKTARVGSDHLGVIADLTVAPSTCKAAA